MVVLRRAVFCNASWSSTFDCSGCHFHSLLHRQKSHGLRSGERGGQATGSFLPTHWLGKWLSIHSVTGVAKCGDAPSCSTTCELVHLEALPLPAALPTHCVRIFIRPDVSVENSIASECGFIRKQNAF